MQVCRRPWPSEWRGHSITAGRTPGKRNVLTARSMRVAEPEGLTGTDLQTRMVAIRPTLGPARTGCLPLHNSAGPCGRVAG